MDSIDSDNTGSVKQRLSDDVNKFLELTTKYPDKIIIREDVYSDLKREMFNDSVSFTIDNLPPLTFDGIPLEIVPDHSSDYVPGWFMEISV